MEEQLAKKCPVCGGDKFKQENRRGLQWERAGSYCTNCGTKSALNALSQKEWGKERSWGNLLGIHCPWNKEKVT